MLRVALRENRTAQGRVALRRVCFFPFARRVERRSIMSERHGGARGTKEHLDKNFNLRLKLQLTSFASSRSFDRF